MNSNIIEPLKKDDFRLENSKGSNQVRKYLIVIPIIITILAAIFVTTYKKEKVLDFNKIIKEVNQERKAKLESATNIDINQYIYNVTGDKEGFTDEEIETLLQPRAVKQGNISKEDALGDTEYLFKLFKYVYGGYSYYGGDRVFNQVKNEVFDSINEKDELSANELNSIFVEKLSFITDGHLSIGGTGINQKHRLYYYCNQQLEIKMNSKSYYFLADNKKRYIKSINDDEEIENYLKLSINENGELVYYIGILQTDVNALLSLTIEYNFDSETKKDIIKLEKVSRKIYSNPTAFEQKTIEGIPVLICRKFDDKDEEITLKYFAGSSSELQNQKVFIIDLRGNGGGGSEWSDFWFENYTGTDPCAGETSVKRYSKLYLVKMKKQQEAIIEPFLQKYNMPELNEFVEKYFQEKNEVLANEEYDTLEITNNEIKWVDNNNIIFVLTDKTVASSAELFVNQLRTLNNVVFVGTNTSGSQDALDIHTIYLPNSNLPVSIGVGLNILKYTPHFIDGTGFKPDIWLDYDDMLERVIRLCDNYNLK